MWSDLQGGCRYRMTPHPADCIVNQTFEKANRATPYIQPENIRAWFYTIWVKFVFDILRNTVIESRLGIQRNVWIQWFIIIDFGGL